MDSSKQTSDARPKPDALLDQLRAARDTARLQVHLLSMDARQRLRQLETGIETLETKLEQNSDELLGTASLRAHELSRAIGDVLREVDGSRELATPAEEVMNSDLLTCSPSDSLSDGARIMWERDCGVVPVVDASGQLVGMLTDRDVCMAAYTRGQPLAAMSVRSTMSSPPHSVAPAESLGAVLKRMGELQLRRLAVTHQGRLLGVISLADVARHVRRRGRRSLPAQLALSRTLCDVSEGRAGGAPDERGKE